ncbi:MAG: hypothetical protein ABEI99_09635 [Halobaculum sp.]
MGKSIEELQELAESDLPGEEATDGSDGEVSDTDTRGTDEDDIGDGGETGGRLSGIRQRLPGVPRPSTGTLFAPKRFLLALALSVAGLVVGGAIPFVGVVTQYLGLFAATFGYGVAAKSSAYTEAGLAGAVAAAVALLLGTLTTGGFVVGADLLGRYGLPITGVGVGVGLLVSLIGHYFGRDLRAGLTKDI